MSENFQVDLHGIVDLLSNHLYSSPRVYLRELLQNAVDAITARQAVDAGRAADGSTYRRRTGLLSISDTGIGLLPDQVRELLATIGRSSKRDEIGFARSEFLGQFGIGLLSAFMVADEIEVVTQPGRRPDHALGRYGGRPLRARRHGGPRRDRYDGDADRPGAVPSSGTNTRRSSS